MPNQTPRDPLNPEHFEGPSRRFFTDEIKQSEREAAKNLSNANTLDRERSKQHNDAWKRNAEEAGMDIESDLESGGWKQRADASGNPLYKEQDWKFRNDPKDGKVEVKRDRYGNTEVRAASIKPNKADPNDPKLYFDDGSAAGHVDDLLAKKDSPEHWKTAAGEWKEKGVGLREAAALKIYDDNLNAATSAQLTAKGRMENELTPKLAELDAQRKAIELDPNFDATLGKRWWLPESFEKMTPEAKKAAQQHQNITAQIDAINTEWGDLDYSTSKDGDLTNSVSKARDEKDLWVAETKMGKHANLIEQRKSILLSQGIGEEKFADDPIIKQLTALREEMGLKVNKLAEARDPGAVPLDPNGIATKEELENQIIPTPEEFDLSVNATNQSILQLSETPMELRNEDWIARRDNIMAQAEVLNGQAGLMNRKANRERTEKSMRNIDTDRYYETIEKYNIDETEFDFFLGYIGDGIKNITAKVAGADSPSSFVGREASDKLFAELEERHGTSYARDIVIRAGDRKLLDGDPLYFQGKPQQWRKLRASDGIAVSRESWQPEALRKPGVNHWKTSLNEAIKENAVTTEQAEAYDRVYTALENQSDMNMRLRVQDNLKYQAWLETEYPDINAKDFGQNWDYVDEFLASNTDAIDEALNPLVGFAGGLFGMMAGSASKLVGWGTNEAADLFRAEGNKVDVTENAAYKWGEDIEAAFQSWKDPRQQDDTADKFAEMLGSAAGFLAPAAGVNSVVRGLNMSEKATKLLTLSTVSGLGGAVNSTQLLTEAKAAGLSDKDAWMPFIYGGLIGLGEAVPIMNWANRMTGNGAGQVKKAVVRALIEMTEEAVQESLFNQLPNNAIAQIYYDQDRELFEGFADSAGGGGSVGAIVSLFTSAAGRLRLGQQNQRLDIQIGDQSQVLTDTGKAMRATSIGPDVQLINRTVGGVPKSFAPLMIDDDTGHSPAEDRAEKAVADAYLTGDIEQLF
jgi:hypothetical protein